MHAVKSVAMPMTAAGSTPASCERLGHRVPQHVDVVVGDLQRPVRAETAPVGQRLVEHRVRVVVRGRAELVAVGDPDDDGATGQGPEVDANDVLLSGRR